jgi:hypothetical protein
MFQPDHQNRVRLPLRYIYMPFSWMRVLSVNELEPTTLVYISLSNMLQAFKQAILRKAGLGWIGLVANI